MDASGCISSWDGFEDLRDQLRCVAKDLKTTSEFIYQNNRPTTNQLGANANRAIRMGYILEYIIHLCTREHNINPNLVDEELESILG